MLNGTFFDNLHNIIHNKHIYFFPLGFINYVKDFKIVPIRSSGDPYISRNNPVFPNWSDKCELGFQELSDEFTRFQSKRERQMDSAKRVWQLEHSALRENKHNTFSHLYLGI